MTKLSTTHPKRCSQKFKIDSDHGEDLLWWEKEDTNLDN